MDDHPNTPLENPEQPLNGCSPTWIETTGTATLVVSKRDRLLVEITEARLSLSPAPREDLVKALTSALILCAPAGFSESDRVAWLKAAAVTVQDVPADLLKRAIEQIRKTADHPAKIVPGIMAIVQETWDWRRDRLHWLNKELNQPVFEALPAPGPKPEVQPCTPEEAAAIMAEYGLGTEAREQVKRVLGAPRAPTREDYIAMGVDPGSTEHFVDRAA